jgi:hypothetical protein
MFDARARKAASLEALYARMPRAELEARLRGGALVPQARDVARTELQRREAAEAAEATAAQVPANPADKDRDARDGLLIVAGVTAVVLGLLWFVTPTGLYVLMLALFVPTVLAPLGKLFPMWGKVLAGLLILAPVGFGLWRWQRGDLAWKAGDYRPLGTLMAWGVLTALLLACWAVAGSLLIGARHRGSWGELSEDLSRMRKEKLDEVGRRR